MPHRTKASGFQISESYQGRRIGPRRGYDGPGRTLARGLAIAGLALLLPIAAAAEQAQTPAAKPNPWTLCAKATNLIERQEGVPRQLLRAISKVESGRFYKKRQVVMAWPWTVMAEGRGRYLPTKSAAIAEVEGLKARGIRNIDVGCMQVNLHYHPDAFADLNQAFDPIANVAYAASYLKSLRIQEGSWSKAVARYHSADPGRYKQYRMKVHVAWRQERAKFLAALSELQAVRLSEMEPLPVIMTWHQASVAEPFHMQLASLNFAAAPVEFGSEAGPVEPEAIVAMAYDPPSTSLAAREISAPWGPLGAVSAWKRADPILAIMTAPIVAREPVEFIPPLGLPVAIAARQMTDTAPPTLTASLSVRETTNFFPLGLPADIAAREPTDFFPPMGLPYVIAARGPADSPIRASAAALPPTLGDVYPGFARAAPIRPGEQWGLVWPLLQPHAERVGRRFIGLLQSLPTEAGGNG